MTRAQSGKSAPDPCCTDCTDEIRSEADVYRYAQRTCLTNQPTGSVGIETEWLVVDVASLSRPVPPARTLAVLADGTPEELTLPGGTRVTFEPGGQLELSAPPLPLPDALARTAADLAGVRSRLADAGLALVGMGTDPLRPARRALRASRYAAMERYFRAGGWTAGLTMMCSTASVQVNLDAGTPAQWTRRFELAHALGPVLLAMFAASPVLAGAATGWASTRQAVWAEIDPTRTGPVASSHQPDPPTAWADYLLAARVMLVRGPDGDSRLARRASTFAQWVAGDGPVVRPPSVTDLKYHATTVFPPVRPRGWLELRYLDAQPAGNWPVAVALTTVLLDDPHAADTAADACAPVARRWGAAARSGLGDTALHQAAWACAAAARDGLERMGADASLLTAVDAFIDRYVEPGRCPADDLADRLADEGPQGLLQAELDGSREHPSAAVSWLASVESAPDTQEVRDVVAL
ncbi:ergothioneine biosynthesis glutamate--cysteine ligase EgtA [Frankia sp. Cppng1_Ct_nod]|uniref:ergothioneine biosynthesis glutamate--cysteine ligase EgtA n=1 Tax=Frankia sp. Cppng1_Ct_nod TaxID=2897162 RepID=UPI0010411BBB|nr:ergothioneine biosynthesis glutamate--cysteine ligase EgtA [Frankia sp. Cppng1_Ct_nod]